MGNDDKMVDVIEIDWVPEYEGLYLASTNGNVYGRKSDTMLEPYHRNGYPSVKLCKDGKPKSTHVHRIIAETFVHNDSPETRTDVDHISRDKQDNRASNLRWATRSENTHNRTKKAGASSQYHGVSWDARDNKWKASICVAGAREKIIYSDSEEECARAYDTRAIELYGDRANINFPRASPVSQS